MTELSDTDRLHAISQATNDDGTIDVELHDFNRSEADDMVSVEFLTPDGDLESEVMPWPKEDSEDYKFVRIFDQTGYGIISAKEACEQSITVKAEREPWRLHAPHTYTRRERISHKWGDIKHSFKRARLEGTKDWGFWEMFFASPLMIPFAFIGFLFEAPTSGTDIKPEAKGYSMALWHLAMWAAIIGLTVMLI